MTHADNIGDMSLMNLRQFRSDIVSAGFRVYPP